MGGGGFAISRFRPEKRHETCQKTLMNNVTKLERENLFELVIDGNKRTFSVDTKHRFHGRVPGIAN